MTHIYRILFTTCFFLFAFFSHAQELPLILKNARVVDVEKGMILEPTDLIIENGCVKEIGKNSSKNTKGIVKDLSGMYVMPGLIDAHVHLSNDSKETKQDRIKHLEYYLKHGITSVRDGAGDARILKELNDGVSKGDILGPDIYYSAFMAGPPYFKDNDRESGMVEGWHEPFAPWMQCIYPDTDLDKAMRDAKEWGCTGVKIYGGFDREMLMRLSQKARQHNLEVWGHATLFPAKPQDAADACMHVISHANMLEWEGVADTLSSDIFENYKKYYEHIDRENMSVTHFLQTVKKNNLILDPTLYICIVNGMEWAARFVKEANEMGVKICAGTDYINDLDRDLPYLFDEMQLYFEKCAFTPQQVLLSATKTAAEALGVADKKGTVCKGKIADLIVLKGNPLNDIKELRNPQWVIKRGKIVKFQQ